MRRSHQNFRNYGRNYNRDSNSRNEAWQANQNENQYYNDEVEENKVELIQRQDDSVLESEEQKSVSSAADNEDVIPRQRSERSYLYQDLEDFELNNHNNLRQMDRLNIPSVSYRRNRVSLNGSYENHRLINR